MNHEQFRALFPALQTWTWLDTPGCPPAARPVREALLATIDDWSSGSFDWTRWQAATQAAEEALASLLHADPEHIASTSSLAEAATIVSRSYPGGEILVLEDEFRSNLLPWVENSHTRVVARIAPRRTDDLLDAIGPKTKLVTVSHVTTLDGDEADLSALRHATRDVGAKLFVNATQSLGALTTAVQNSQADFIGAHGYKWLLAPRGAAWLSASAEAAEELRPAISSWTSGREHTDYFGLLPLEHGAGASNGSPAWLATAGALAALKVHSSIAAETVESHVRALARRFREAAQARGWLPSGPGGSHIEVFNIDDSARIRAAMARHKIRALTGGRYFRVGVHFFNSDRDIDSVVEALGYPD